MDRLLAGLRRSRRRRCLHGCGFVTRKSGILAIHYEFDHCGDPVIKEETA